MVLSNKKLKQKLRAAKVELVAAAETQNNTSNKDGVLRATHLLNLLDAQKPRLSKREKRRQKPENNGEIKKQKQSASGAEEKTEAELKSADVKLQKKKRKRDESEPLEKEKGKTPERLKKKKKTKNKRKPKKKAEKGQVKQEMQDQNGTEASREQLDAKARPSNDRKEPEQSTKIYVGGIPYYSTEDDIRSYFESCGTITDIDCMTFPDTGKFRGIAIITFKTEAATKRALARDGSDMGGLYLKVMPFKSERVNKLQNFSPTAVEGYNRIYVGNLSWDVTEDDLRKLFSDCTISSIRFGEDKETGEFKGYAHVDFADSLSLNMALKLDQSVLCGRNVKISCAVPKKGIVTKLKSMPKNNHGGEAKVTVVSKIEENSSVKVSVDGEYQETNSEAMALSSKLRRRTCYECGEKGHVSSSCPKNQTADVTKLSVAKNNHRGEGEVTAASKVEENSLVQLTVVAKDHENISVKVSADSKDQETNSAATAVSSKIRRRTCYECGEKGHLSSSCPKNQAADVTMLTPMPKVNHFGEGEITAVSKVEDNSTIQVTAVAKKHENSSVKVGPDSKYQETNSGAMAVSSKIRRRTCYECGERGHLSSSCPKNQTADVTMLTPMPKINHFGEGEVTAVSKMEDNSTIQVTAVVKKQENSSVKVGADSKYQETNSGAMAVSSKVKRRTCYECGEKGHLSSSCPKSQTADVTMLTPMPKINHFGEGEVTAVRKIEDNSTILVTAVVKRHENSSVEVGADSKYQEANSGAMAVSSKIRRHTCYECGEKGHLSSSCPKNQAADLANPGAL